jgi:uncharacterized protein YbjQ (UPF0145 family)
LEIIHVKGNITFLEENDLPSLIEMAYKVGANAIVNVGESKKGKVGTPVKFSDS